jgi:PncC family amidohydrolase
MKEDLRLEAQVGNLLKAKGWTICAAESCTGGLVLHRLTNVSGSSGYVLGGVVAYSNQVKQSLLHVRQGSLIAYGAVSEQVASEMAAGAKRLFESDIALAVTGIAGPGGGTAEKPVGLTYMALAGPGDKLVVRRQVWEGDREAIKSQSADALLAWVLELA